MAMGSWSNGPAQGELFLSSADLPRSPGHDDGSLLFAGLAGAGGARGRGGEGEFRVESGLRRCDGSEGLRRRWEHDQWPRATVVCHARCQLQRHGAGDREWAGGRAVQI
jgi:hypothetical protein